jgi:hypothetical protein
MVKSTHAHDKPQAHTARFSLPVAKDGATTLTYRVRVRF